MWSLGPVSLGLNFFLPNKWVSQFQTFKVSSSSNILGNANGIAHEVGSDWWLIWWDMSKSPIFPETFWLLIYRVRQAAKEENFLLILVLRRTFPAGEGKEQFYPQEKKRDQELHPMVFLLCLQLSEPVFIKKTSYILTKEVLSFFNLSKFETAVS